jgi:hypothetical protein
MCLSREGGSRSTLSHILKDKQMKLFYVEHLVKHQEKDPVTNKPVTKEKLDTVAYLARSTEHLAERLAHLAWTPQRDADGYQLSDDWDNVHHLRCA